MNSSTKAIIFVIVLGFIAVVATLPADNPVKMKLTGMVESITGKPFNFGNAAQGKASDKPAPVHTTQTQTATVKPQAVEMPTDLPFDETRSSGSKQVDALIGKANNGDVKAQFSLGQAYREGRNVQADNVTAYMWFNIARANGDTRAKDELRTLSSAMNSQQVAQGQKLASLWWETYKR